MKSFLKYTLATIVGLIVVNVVMFFFFFMAIGALATISEKTVSVKDNSILTIKLEGEIFDRVSDHPLDNIDFLTMAPKKTLGMNNILSSIKKAAKDDRITGIYLDLTEIYATYGALAFTQEIRNALEIFKESGKFIYSYSNLGYSQKSYYLATVADKVYVNPETPLLLLGMSSSISFYKEMLNKLGIQAEVIKVGKFKSAVEPFISDKMSEENRTQVKKYLDSSWGNITSAISESRNIPIDSINALADRFDIYTTKQFKEWGYFDGTMYENEMLSILKEKCNLNATQKLNLISLKDYQNVSIPTQEIEFNKDKIAVIYAQGEIGMVEETENAIGPDLTETIRKVRQDKNVKAIVLRVNSPGGSALTSEIIWKELEIASKSLPLIASMGNVAASGGYYIACPADTIVAEPTTLTGSIGIFGMFFNGEKLINNIGINTNSVKTNKHSDFGGSYPLGLPINSRPLSTYERNVLQNYVNQGYETFLNRVMSGRDLSREELNAIAEGRVWTGEDAQKIGLVDVLGGMDDAIKIAAHKAGLEKYSIVEYPTIKDPFEILMKELTGNVKARMMKEELGAFHSSWQQLKNIVRMQGVMARIPYDITLN